MNYGQRKQAVGAQHTQYRAQITDLQQQITNLEIEAHRLEGEYRLLEELEREAAAPPTLPDATQPQAALLAMVQQLQQDQLAAQPEQARALVQARHNMDHPTEQPWTGPWQAEAQAAPSCTGIPLDWPTEPIDIQRRFPDFFPSEALHPVTPAEQAISDAVWRGLEHA